MDAERRTLAVLRHAKAAWPERVSDARRPLADRGRRDAPAVGRWLHRNLPELALVLCSPAARARETWQLAAAELRTEPEVWNEPRLYRHDADGLIRAVSELPDGVRTVLLVGHNPDVENLVELLTGEYQQFRTSTVAVLSARSRWLDISPGWASLEAIGTPRAGFGTM